MNQNNDYLSPDNSPQKLRDAGVKRVNNVPIMIAIGILTLFIALIAFVANKRANAQNQPIEVAQIKSSKKNTLSLANEVVGNHKISVIPSHADTVTSNEIAPLSSLELLPNKEEPLKQEISETEIERIRQEKTQEFEEAIKAKSSVMVDNPRLNNRDASKTSMNSNDMALNIDPAYTFKEQLALLQERQAKALPQNLGGEENEIRWHLNTTLQNPSSRFELRAGSIIPGIMITGINSELPGPVIGQVKENVYDTATGKYLLIPQGTKILGVYSNDIGFGNNSVMVAWQRLVFPDGKALDVGSMPGSDSAGYVGFRDKINHHYVQVFGSALLMSGIVGGITYSQNSNQTNQMGGVAQPTANNALSQALGQQLGEVSSQLILKNMNRSPTAEINSGYRFNIIVVKDLTFKQPYKQFAY